jgi:GNAT superfamily N-acetyltransferase
MISVPSLTLTYGNGFFILCGQQVYYETEREGESIKNIIGHIEENFFAVCRYWGSLNTSFKKDDAIEAMSTGVPVSDVNWAFNEKPLNHNSLQHITAVKEYYRTLNLRFWWWVYPRAQAPATGAMLQEAGLYLFTKVPCMAATFNDSLLHHDVSEHIKILPVRNREDLLIWTDISFEGFEMPARARKSYGDFVASFDLDSLSPLKLFLACLDEKPVATSLLFTHQDTAGIYYVSTLPAYRNRGCGLSVTKAAMRSAKAAGFNEVILQATPMGERIYKRTGFKEYCQAEIYKLRK